MSLILTAFLMGLFGLIHCFTMCGSLSMAVGFSVPANKSYLKYASIISFSRIISYSILGFVANYFTQSIISITDGNILYLSLVASLLMFGVGLHIANVSNYVLKIERLGAGLNRFIDPLKKKIFPLNSIKKCIAYGAFWGFLPCGLIYTALSLALSAPSPLNASLVMLAFGVGTLPAVIGMTVFNARLSDYLKNNSIRLIFGLIVILMSAWHGAVTLKKLVGFDI